MHTIQNINEEATRIFGTSRTTLFLEILKNWISEKEEIISFKIDRKNDRVLVLTFKDNGQPKDHFSYEEDYKLTRFFPMGEKWEASIDYSGQTAREMMEKLLKDVCL